DVRLHEPEARRRPERRQVLQLDRRVVEGVEVVDGDHVHAERHQALAQMAPDEPRPAGDEHFHDPLLCEVSVDARGRGPAIGAEGDRIFSDPRAATGTSESMRTSPTRRSCAKWGSGPGSWMGIPPALG